MLLLGIWGGKEIAVKVYDSHHETEWLREVEIYNTYMLTYPNILKFISSDMKETGMRHPIIHPVSDVVCFIVFTIRQRTCRRHDSLVDVSRIPSQWQPSGISGEEEGLVGNPRRISAGNFVFRWFVLFT